MLSLPAAFLTQKRPYSLICNAACTAALALPGTSACPLTSAQLTALTPLAGGGRQRQPAGFGGASQSKSREQLPAKIQYSKWQAQKKHGMMKHAECKYVLNARSPVSMYNHSGVSKGYQGLFEGLQNVYWFKHFPRK